MLSSQDNIYKKGKKLDLKLVGMTHESAKNIILYVTLKLDKYLKVSNEHFKDKIIR